MSNDAEERGSLIAALALFAVIAVLIAVDLIADYGEGASAVHVGAELAVLIVAAAGILLLWKRLRSARVDLRKARIEASAWRRENRELLAGLAAAIEVQFASWQLSKAEAEVGLMLLKGLSHKEIARLRQTSERTVREQARALYRKSGLSGRASLSAYFLEDLLLPGSDQTDRAPGE